MPIVKRFSILLLGLLAACGGGGSGGSGGSGGAVGPPPLELALSELPVALADTGARYARNVPYGDGARNVLDIYLPDCEAPTGLLIYIHAGGFIGGDKSQGHADTAFIREFLQACVSYASINYFLLQVPPAEQGTGSIAGQGGVLTSLRDAARALQFIRFHSANLNIDPERVALTGRSAGAGASLWLGTHDDMADLASADPVLRQSTRVRAVGAIATQATYDLLRWEELLEPVAGRFEAAFNSTDIPALADALVAGNYAITLLGVPTVADIYSAQNAAYRANVDMLALMDAGDAPMFVQNFDTRSDPQNMFLHHGLYAIALKQRADEVGLQSVVYSSDPEFTLQDPSGEQLADFLLRHLR